MTTNIVLRVCNIETNSYFDYPFHKNDYKCRELINIIYSLVCGIPIQNGYKSDTVLMPFKLDETFIGIIIDILGQVSTLVTTMTVNVFFASHLVYHFEYTGEALVIYVHEVLTHRMNITSVPDEVLTLGEFEQLPMTKSTNKNKEECSICVQPFNKRNITVLICGHQFHKSCIRTWLTKENNMCPYCRAKVLKKWSPLMHDWKK